MNTYKKLCHIGIIYLGYYCRSEILCPHFMKFLTDILLKCFPKGWINIHAHQAVESTSFSVFSLWSPWHLLISPQQENSTVSSWKQTVTLSCQCLSPPDHGSVCMCVRIYVWRIAVSALRGLLTLSPEAIVTVAWQWLSLAVVTTYSCQCLPGGIMTQGHFSVFYLRHDSVSHHMDSKTHHPLLTSLLL